jgi:hypothetical protein
MPVSADVQSAITLRYAQLGNAVLRDPAQERNVLAPDFHDRARMKVSSFNYQPLTVVVEKIVKQGDRLEVHAQYVGIHGHNAEAVDHWQLIDGQWLLTDHT